MKVRVYHGGTEKVEFPLCHVGRDRLDFGKGFYVTLMRDQAEMWARYIADRRGEEPLLNVYYLDRDAVIANAKCLVFRAYDKEWLDFITANRFGFNAASSYDYVEGGIADDRVIDTVNLYMSGLIDADTALGRLAEHQPNNQICFLSQRLINNYLEYEKTVYVR